MKYVTFTSHEIKVTVVVKLAGPTVVVQHDPEGWQQIQRKWRTSFTEWEGAPTYELQIPLVFDQLGFNPRVGSAMNSVEKGIRDVERLGEKLANKPRTPILRVDAHGAIPHDYTNNHTKQWVVATVAWGDYIINDNLSRVRQECTLTLWEYVPDKVLQANERLPARPVPKKYRIRNGDTLQKIAAYFYGDQAEWHSIAKLNKIHNPLKLKVHHWIKLPSVTHKK
jgi:nucleoid-associated protein YgaU